MATTACLYNLIKNELGDKLHPSSLKSMVDVNSEAIELFPNHQQL